MQGGAKGKSRHRSCLTIATALLLIGSFAAPGGANVRPGRTRRVTVTPAGSRPDGISPSLQSMSADGRVVVFAADGVDLGANDSNTFIDVFARNWKDGKTERVSDSSRGTDGFGVCLTGDPTRVPAATISTPSASKSGRYVAFDSCFANLVEGDTNGMRDIFLRDRVKKTTRRVSLGSEGQQGNGEALDPSVSNDGRYVAFTSSADNLVQDDTNRAPDVFVHDTETGTTKRISVSSEGTQTTPPARGSHDSGCPDLEGTGRYIAFVSGADNLVPADSNTEVDAFVHDLRTKTTERVSLRTGGEESRPIGNGLGTCSSQDGGLTISTGGRYVAFDSWATDLVPNDSNVLLGSDVFVYDRKTRRTQRATVSSNGEQGEAQQAGGSQAMISGNGRYVAFSSAAANFVEEADTDVDAFVHDLITGATTLVSRSDSGEEVSCSAGLEYPGAWPSLGHDGRNVSFGSCADGLVEDDGSTSNIWQIYVRDVGDPLGIGGLSLRQGQSPNVAGAPGFSRIGFIRRTSPSDADLFADADIVGATTAYRAQTRDLFLALELRELSALGPGSGSLMVHGFSFVSGEVTYEVRAQKSIHGEPDRGGAEFGLFRCQRTCRLVSALEGGYGTTGARVVFSVPLGEIGMGSGGKLKDIVAFTALGSYRTGTTKLLDRLAIK